MYPPAPPVATFLDHFDKPSLHQNWRWLNPPPHWQLDPSGLIIHPAPSTDFWQETHYGFRADNGHLLFTEIAGDFTLTTRVRFYPVNQYDQAGLMVRSGPLTWIKTSVEFEPDGPARLGAVVTNHGFSDWSVQNFPGGQSEISLRVRKQASDFIIEFAHDETSPWTLLRVTHLHLEHASPLACGPYACSPKGTGFRAEFPFVQIDRHT